MTKSAPTVDLCSQLIARQSLSPDDAGCQEILCERLAKMDFAIEALPCGKVSNFWARRGREAPLLCLAGHTDVVPAGDLAAWNSDPFQPLIKDGKLFGRGAADMKGGLAALLTACERFVAAHPNHAGSIAFLVTSDEESIAVDGTRHVMETLTARQEKIDFCLIGEPSSRLKLGDTVKIGRRGSLNGILEARGIEGHAAYPQRALNPIHFLLPGLAALCQEQWDQGNAHFPPTSFQITDVHAGYGANNVIPQTASALCNWRFSPETSAEEIRRRAEEVVQSHCREWVDGHLRRAASAADSHELPPEPPQELIRFDFQLSGLPFLSPQGPLTEAVSQGIKEVAGIDTQLSTSGGTSDGRFIAPSGAEVVELGPCNATIHKHNEFVLAEDLEALSRIYEDILRRLLT